VSVGDSPLASSSSSGSKALSSVADSSLASSGCSAPGSGKLAFDVARRDLIVAFGPPGGRVPAVP